MLRAGKNGIGEKAPPAYRPFDSLTMTLALFLATLAVNLQMPLYRAYAADAGFGNGMTSLVFAAYVAGLLPTLLCFGGVSNRIGRKPAVLAGLAAALAATLIMIAWPEAHFLFASRVLQGVGVGLCLGAGSAYLAASLGGIRAASRAAGLVAVSTSMGFGGGALFTGTLLLSGPTLLPVSYAITAGAILACLAMTACARRDPPLGGPLFRLPHFPAGSLSINLSIAMAWAVTGLVISLMPAQLALHGLSAWAGHALFLVNGAGVLVQPWARRMAPRNAILLGAVLLPLGYGSMLYGAWGGSVTWVFLGAALAGSACYGFTYLGGLAEIAARAGGAGAVSGYFLCAYLGFGIPSVLLGFLSDLSGLMPALIGFGGLLLPLSLMQALAPGKRKDLAAP